MEGHYYAWVKSNYRLNRRKLDDSVVCHSWCYFCIIQWNTWYTFFKIFKDGHKLSSMLHHIRKLPKTWSGIQNVYPAFFTVYHECGQIILAHTSTWWQLCVLGWNISSACCSFQTFKRLPGRAVSTLYPVKERGVRKVNVMKNRICPFTRRRRYGIFSVQTLYSKTRSINTELLYDSWPYGSCALTHL